MAETETVRFMGELIDICIDCNHAVDHCKCTPEEN